MLRTQIARTLEPYNFERDIFDIVFEPYQCVGIVASRMCASIKIIQTLKTYTHMISCIRGCARERSRSSSKIDTNTHHANLRPECFAPSFVRCPLGVARARKKRAHKTELVSHRCSRRCGEPI